MLVDGPVRHRHAPHDPVEPRLFSYFLLKIHHGNLWSLFVDGGEASLRAPVFLFDDAAISCRALLRACPQRQYRFAFRFSLVSWSFPVSELSVLARHSSRPLFKIQCGIPYIDTGRCVRALLCVQHRPLPERLIRIALQCRAWLRARVRARPRARYRARLGARFRICGHFRRAHRAQQRERPPHAATGAGASASGRCLKPFHILMNVN